MDGWVTDTLKLKDWQVEVQEVKEFYKQEIRYLLEKTHR